MGYTNIYNPNTDHITIPDDSRTISHTEVLPKSRWLELFGGLERNPTPTDRSRPLRINQLKQRRRCLYLWKTGLKHYVEHTTIFTKQKSPYSHHYYIRTSTQANPNTDETELLVFTAKVETSIFNKNALKPLVWNRFIASRRLGTKAHDVFEPYGNRKSAVSLFYCCSQCHIYI